MGSKYGLATCRACGATIRWVITTKLRRMPCDPWQYRFTPGGGNETFVTTDGRVIRGKRSKCGPQAGFISHFATCPYADRMRKKGKEE